MTDVTVLKKMCCSDLEMLFINYKPFYSPLEICLFILVSFYIHPQAHVSLALLNSIVTDCSGVIQVPGHHHLTGPEVGQPGQSRRHCKKGPAEAVLSSPAEEVQPATGAVVTVLLCHHWIRPLHVNNFLVQLSYQIWSQKTTEDSPDCWADHWYNPPHSPRTLSNHSGPSHPAHSLFELLPSGRCYRALSTRTTRHRNSFFPQAIHLMNTWQ